MNAQQFQAIQKIETMTRRELQKALKTYKDNGVTTIDRRTYT